MAHTAFSVMLLNFVFLPQDTFQLTILKVKAMEVMSFHQVAQGLRLKGSETRITNLPNKPTKKEQRISKESKLINLGCDCTNAERRKLTHRPQSLHY